MDEYIIKQKKIKRDLIWEVYITSPAATSDTSQWKKQLFYPFANSINTD
jgi:hypothetical protein